MKKSILRSIYILRVSCMHLKGNYKLQIIVVICLALGLLIPFASGAKYDSMFMDLQISQPKNPNSTYKVSTSDDLIITEQDLGNLKKELELTNLAYTEFYNCKLEYENGTQDSNMISGVILFSENMKDFIGYKVEDGRFFTHKDYADRQKVCVVETVKAKEKNIAVGDNINLNGIEFQVVGIIRNNQFKMIIPADTVTFDKSINISRTLYCDTQQKKLDTNYITEAITKIRPNSNVNSIYTAWEEVELINSQMSQVIKNEIPLILVTLLFALTNITCVLIGKIQRQKKSFLIKRALGASIKQVFIELFTENLILILVANLILFACFPVVKIILSDVMGDMLMAKYAFLAPIAIGILITAIVSTILLFYITRLKLADELRGEV